MSKTMVEQLLTDDEALLSAGTCLQCGGPISAAMRATTKYCKTSCRVAAYNRRQRDKVRNRMWFATTRQPQPQPTTNVIVELAADIPAPPRPEVDEQPELIDEIDRWFREPIVLDPADFE